MPWNARPDARRLAPGHPEVRLLGERPGGIEQVGCVYTAQGFEFDYVGVIFGPDLVYRPMEGWVGQREYSRSSVVRRSQRGGSEPFVDLIKHTYRVLLTLWIARVLRPLPSDATRDPSRPRIERPT